MLRTLAHKVTIGPLLALYPSRRVSGLKIIFTDLDVDRDKAARQVADALQFLAVHSSRYHLRVMRYTRHIVVWMGNYTCATSLGGVQIASEMLGWADDEALASILVHEATHLRLMRLGVETTPTRHERIERRCVEEQMAFHRVASDSGRELADELEAAMRQPGWANTDRQEDFREMVEAGKIPLWTAKLLGYRGDRAAH